MQFRTFALSALLFIGCHSRDDHSAPSGGSGASPAGSGASITASGASPTPAPPAAAGDPCRYATNEEIGAAIGAPIVATERKTPVQCAYYPTPPPSNGLYVTVGDSSPYMSMKQMMRNTTPVTGIGDDGIWAAPQLIVKAGPKMITIAVMDVRWKNGDSKGAAEAVARAVLPRVAP